MRKLLLASSLIAFVPHAAVAAAFSDVPSDAWYATYVSQAAADGIVSGYVDAQGRSTGKFGPANNVTIAEALKITMESSGFMADAMRTDSPYMGHWAQRYADAAVEAHFFLSVTKEQLDWPATRAEMAQIVADAYGIKPKDLENLNDYTDVSMSHDFAAGIEAMTINDIMVGDGRATHCVGTPCQKTTFRPDKTLNRAEAVKIVIEARARLDRPGQASSHASSQTAEKNTVHYTSSGFSPSSITIKKGETLTILNETNASMSVNSDPHPTHTSYPPMNSPTSSPAGGFYKFQFNVEGEYHYHDHFNPGRKGTVIVED